MLADQATTTRTAVKYTRYYRLRDTRDEVLHEKSNDQKGQMACLKWVFLPLHERLIRCAVHYRISMWSLSTDEAKVPFTFTLGYLLPSNDSLPSVEP